MEDMGLGAGLAALAFWGFISVVVVGGMWYSIREKEMKQETLRRLVESGQEINEDLAVKLMNINAVNEHLDRDLKISGVLMLPIAAGLAIFGLILGIQYPEALAPLLGVSVLVGVIGAGLLYAARLLEQWQSDK